MIVLVICWVQGATSCRDTMTESAAATRAVTTSGRNSVAAIVLISQIFRLRAALNKAKRQAILFWSPVAMHRSAYSTRRRILIVCHCYSGSEYFTYAMRVHFYRTPRAQCVLPAAHIYDFSKLWFGERHD